MATELKTNHYRSYHETLFIMQPFRQYLSMLLLALGVSVLSFGVEALQHEAASCNNTLGGTEASSGNSTSALHARTLVHNNVWATLSTISVQFNGVPYGHIVSYSDGDGSSTGHLFFYLTPLDPAGTDLSTNPTASVAISMAQQGKNACTMDVEDPTCWMITLTGKVNPVPADQHDYAKKALFSKHPQMEYWPKNHNFSPYVLEIENIILLDSYGEAKHVPVDEYYQVKL